MTSSSTESIHKIFKYDVFLSFRGEDTRTNFIDHLYYALQQKRIYTYKDDEAIKKGKLISDELIRSIEDSKFYIIVFSKNYASSRWCLDELVKIMECQKMTEHTAFPVFYDVEPTEVRKQIGAVGEAFRKHENDDAAGRWKEALRGAADLAGWELKKTANGHGTKFIQKIIDHISLELRSINFCVDEKLVGMDTRVKDVILCLETDIDDVRMIGIKGMGGGGKTTLARAVFDQISSQFEGKCFVENVREVSKASLSGLTSLQNKVLTDVLDDPNIKLSSVYDGKKMMMRRMCSKKVVIVLDDVDDIEQLEALAGAPNWFKLGTRIIITTRDEQVLVAHRVKWILNVNLLWREEAICLFSKYAFGREIPIQGYEELSGQVVRYAAGLPLTIRVLGSFLCGKNKSEWIDALKRLKTIPLKETLQKLELSYLSLEEDYKEIFLNVACILKGWPTDLAIEALEGCGFHARNGLRVLEQKSLISTDSLGLKNLGMHDHIEEMGMNIVRRLHPDKPNKHSRLWIELEIKDILANDLGTKATRYIRFHLEKVNLEIAMKGLRKMKELRFLHVSGENDFLEEREYDNVSQNFPNALQYLHWHKYPLRSLPNTFQANNLVVLKMVESKIVQLWEGVERKVLNKLKVLDLSYSNLTTLDLGLNPNLEALSLKGCRHLVQLHVPIGCLENLVYLVLSGCLRFTDFVFDKRKGASGSSCDSLEVGPSAELYLIANSLERCPLHPQNTLPKFHFAWFYKDDPSLTNRNLETLLSVGMCACTNLETFSESICGLRHLRKLKLKGYPEAPKDLGQLECLEELFFSTTYLKYLPDSICRLKNLKILKLEFCWCLRKLPEDLGRLECLERLTLSSAKIKHLPDSICKLKHLIFLVLSDCFSLEKLPEDLGRLECLEELHLSFTKIKHLPDSICLLKHLKVLILSSCLELENLPEDFGQLECLVSLTLSSSKIKHLPYDIFVLRNLKDLNIHCSLLEKLPEELGRLECLAKLTLSSLKIRHLPDTICMLKDLKDLKIVHCLLLEKLPEYLDRLECLKSLQLSECKSLQNIPTSICNMKSLRELYVEGTCINHLPQNILLLKGLFIKGSRDLLESSGLTSEIQTYQYEDTCSVTVSRNHTTGFCMPFWDKKSILRLWGSLALLEGIYMVLKRSQGLGKCDSQRPILTDPNTMSEFGSRITKS